jgi:DDE superfamily endonuclease
MWCIGQITAQYRQRMYSLIDLYQRPYHPDEPVVCVDEKSKQLLLSKRPDLPMKSGRTCKVDYEYERRGTRNLFVAVEPLAGWRQVQVTLQRKKEDFVGFIRQLVEKRYRTARRVHLVVDNLNTHFAKVFVDVLEATRATKLLQRIEFHHTPKHGSWLNMAEIEIGILEKQCINARIATEMALKTAVSAWQKCRNQQRKTINWTFTRQKADEKLGKYYVA